MSAAKARGAEFGLVPAQEFGIHLVPPHRFAGRAGNQLHVVQTERQQHGFLEPLVDDPFIAPLLRYACLAGIGFTMSLFVAMLAFADGTLVDAAKRGIIVGSLVAGVAGAVVLRMSPVLRDDK